MAATTATPMSEAPGTKDFDTPQWHAKAPEIQAFSDVIVDLPHRLDAKARAEMVGELNQLLADTIQIRDMYKKHHWQVGGPTFYELHLLFDKHFEEQVEMADSIAERIQLLGGIAVAMGTDVGELSTIEKPPRGREEVPVQISRLCEAHRIIMEDCHRIAEAADKVGDDGTNDLAVSDILRPNELQAWFIQQHLVRMPLVIPKNPGQ